MKMPAGVITTGGRSLATLEPLMTNEQQHGKTVYIIEVDYDNTAITKVKILHMVNGHPDEQTVLRQEIVNALLDNVHIRTLNMDASGKLYSKKTPRS